MLNAIIYTSKTGFTERYAKALAQRTGLPAYSLEAARRVARGAEVIYLGWTMSSLVTGYDKARKRFNVRALCPVGMLPLEADERSAFEHSNVLKGVAVFPLRGGFKMDAQRGIYKVMMRSMLKNIQIKAENGEASQEELAMAKLLSEGGDFYDEARLEPVLSWIAEGCPEPPDRFEEEYGEENEN